VRTTAWTFLALLVIPGCLLVQPLDQARPEDDGSAGSGNGNAGGTSKAGSSGSTSNAGSSNAGRGGGASGGAPSGNAGRGGAASGGAASGGAPSGVDLSLFTGYWYVTDGQITTTCDDGSSQTEAIDPGGRDQVGLGTTSDLIFGPGSNCEILADVEDRNASLNSDTLPCSDNDGTYYYYLTIDAFHFNVSGDGETAEAGMITTVLTTDADDNLLATCEVQQTWNSER
jgi:hypothetical protein